MREAFRTAMRDDVPPVPLAEIVREGRARRRRHRAAVLLTGCLLLLTPPAIVTLRDSLVSGGAGPATPSRPVLARTVRVVASGERVRPLPGVELWLTKNAGHWSTPNGAHSLAPGSGPALTLRLEVVDGRLFLCGIYQGERQPARVRAEMASAAPAGTLLTLAGDPGWMAFYATGQLPPDEGAPKEIRVTVYAADGAVLARSEVAG
ncbi:hypothetical protein SSP24_74630 [Streptomyces spinoverrucosus]|uniref:Uncharacterized protein n=1 Tax=Streptomyces spinoverrucosus TaxID=284043 RepID=A0A4Y3VU96_9ACTN|nr:hypothetical protein SSP24_74630 [Streptomyces spinoverrucosus]GHB96894.1 hypothetical protein GCM10010397_81820 [Streptomyces spinoverrucosus]